MAVAGPNASEALMLLTVACLSVLAQAPDEQGFGSQLVFAVYHALIRGWLPNALKPVFASWRKPSIPSSSCSTSRSSPPRSRCPG